MKLLVISDIHGNLPALELVFLKEKYSYDSIVCLGDVVNYGPWGNECVQLLETYKNSNLIMGNHEENYLNGEYAGKNLIANKFFDLCFNRFEQFDAIRNYLPSLMLDEYYFTHTLNNEYIYVDSNIDQLDCNTFIGHSHYQFKKPVGPYHLVNVGSVGQNRKFINLISYAVIDIENDSVELKSIPYDIEILLSEMRKYDYPKHCLDYYINKPKYFE